jgi:hypothetical protein
MSSDTIINFDDFLGFTILLLLMYINLINIILYSLYKNDGIIDNNNPEFNRFKNLCSILTSMSCFFLFFYQYILFKKYNIAKDMLDESKTLNLLYEEELVNNTFTVTDFVKNKLFKTVDKDCSICLDNMKECDDTIMLACGHFYHTDCIIKSFRNWSTCPCCRHHISPYYLRNITEV